MNMSALLQGHDLLSQASVATILGYAGLLTLAVTLGLCWTYRNRAFWTSSSRNADWIPGPKGEAFMGNAKELKTNGEASCKAWYSLYRRYGPAYEITIPFFRLHVINHPTYLEHIQKHNHKNYIRGSFARNAFSTLHRGSIFMTDGQEWAVQRKAATRAFSKQNFENHITKSLHHWLDILMRLLSNLAKEEKEFDFQELMSRFLFCLFLRLAFHEDQLALDVMSDDPKCLESLPDYVKAFDQATGLFDRRRRDPLWKITEKLSGEDKITNKAAEMFYEKVEWIINKRLTAMKEGYKYNPEDGVDILDLFIQSTTDVYRLSGMIFGFLVAGRDTTAYTTSWFIKEIYHQDNRHLDAVNKMRTEAAELGFADTFLGYSDTSKLKFTNAMWDETARLDTVSPAGQMEAAGDDILPAVPELNMPERHVKKQVERARVPYKHPLSLTLSNRGDIVSYHNYVLSRMPEIWGDDATVFNPYRWFKEDGESISYSPFKYHSWNAGPRSCLGRALATYEGISITTAILQRFDVILSNDTKTYEPLAAMNMGIKGGLPMKLKERVRKL